MQSGSKYILDAQKKKTINCLPLRFPTKSAYVAVYGRKRFPWKSQQGLGAEGPGKFSLFLFGFSTYVNNVSSCQCTGAKIR